MVYAAVASSTLDTPAYAHIRRFEKEQNGRKAMLTLKVQFSGTAFNMPRSNTAHDFLEKATFSGPKRGYTYLEHVAKFNEAYNELNLIGEPLAEHVKVRKFCMSLTELFLGWACKRILKSFVSSVSRSFGSRRACSPRYQRSPVASLPSGIIHFMPPGDQWIVRSGTPAGNGLWMWTTLFS
jgi:hypothetical protein